MTNKIAVHGGLSLNISKTVADTANVTFND